MKWQPIETAPRLNTKDVILACQVSDDGNNYRVMLIRNAFIASEAYKTASPRAYWVEPGNSWPSYPTHWMPLPEPPND